MNMIYNSSGISDEIFLNKVNQYINLIHNGTSIKDIIYYIDEQYIYRLLNDKLDDDEQLNNILYKEEQITNAEYDALLCACEYLNVDINVYEQLQRRKRKLKK